MTGDEASSLLTFSDGVNSGGIHIHVDKLGSSINRSIADVKEAELQQSEPIPIPIPVPQKTKVEIETQIRIASERAVHSIRVADTIFWFPTIFSLVFLLTTTEIHQLISSLSAMLRLLVITSMVFITVFVSYILHGIMFGKDLRDRMMRVTAMHVHKDMERRFDHDDYDDYDVAIRDMWGD